MKRYCLFYYRRHALREAGGLSLNRYGIECRWRRSHDTAAMGHHILSHFDAGAVAQLHGHAIAA